jgi:hypothetical protein
MGMKERRADAELLLRRVRAGVMQPLPPRVLARDGYAFLLAELELQVSILARPVADLELALPELRGKLQGLAGPPPYRSESLFEAYTYPILVAGPEGPITEAYLSFGEQGARLGGDEAQRNDWPHLVRALTEALEAAPFADYEDRLYDPDAGAWIHYGVRDGRTFEDVIEGDEPPEWAE